MNLAVAGAEDVPRLVLLVLRNVDAETALEDLVGANTQAGALYYTSLYLNQSKHNLLVDGGCPSYAVAAAEGRNAEWTFGPWRQSAQSWFASSGRIASTSSTIQQSSTGQRRVKHWKPVLIGLSWYE